MFIVAYLADGGRRTVVEGDEGLVRTLVSKCDFPIDEIGEGYVVFRGDCRRCLKKVAEEEGWSDRFFIEGFMDMRAFLRSVARRRGGRVKLCPVCGSPRVGRYGWTSGWLTPDLYACPDCGYVGHLIVEVEADDEAG